MFLLYEYDLFWAFLIISSLIPILVFFISGFLAPSSKGPEKLSSYESGILLLRPYESIQTPDSY
ncbi:hypothetical protein R6Q59_017463 [Mikania micrantha]